MRSACMSSAVLQAPPGVPGAIQLGWLLFALLLLTCWVHGGSAEALMLLRTLFQQLSSFCPAKQNGAAQIQMRSSN